MNYATKAGLASAAVLPGAGFFVLHHYLFGACFLLPSLASLIYILHHYFNKTLAVTERMVLGELPPDIGILVADILAETNPDTILWLSVAKWVYVGSYLLGIVASIYAGYRRDNTIKSRDQEVCPKGAVKQRGIKTPNQCLHINPLFILSHQQPEPLLCKPRLLLLDYCFAAIFL
jgi:hypothetical protein